MQNIINSVYFKYIVSVIDGLLIGGAGNAYLVATGNLHNVVSGVTLTIAIAVLNVAYDHIVKPYLANISK